MLTTVATLKAQLGIPTADTSQDAILERQIRAASDAIEAECRRVFESQAYDEEYPAHGEWRLLLSGYPVTAVTRISVDDETMDTDDYRLDMARGELRREDGAPWHGVVRAEYTAGYVLPDDPARSLPYDIEDAAIVAAIGEYNTAAAAGIASEQVEQLRIQYGNLAGSGGIIPSVRRVIERHKDWRR